MKDNLFKNVFPSFSEPLTIDKEEMERFIEDQKKDPNSYISRANEIKRRLSEKSEEELRESKMMENIERIAISNEELNANSKKMYELMNLMQNELLTQNENNKEFNDKVNELAIELKDINEGVNKSKTISSFFSNLSGNIAAAVILQFLKM